MHYLKLGQTELTVSRIAMGCWAFAGGSNWGQQEVSQSIATVHTALDLGINFFDTAEGYQGDDSSEAVLGQALVGKRAQAIIATKVSGANLAGPDLTQACERSLRQLKTDYIDLYQLHWPNRQVPLAETVETLERLRQQGKIRLFGVSNFGVQDLADFLTLARCETNQLPYSLLWRAIEYRIRQSCQEAGVSILCYSPLMQGLLSGKFASADDFPQGRARTRHFSSRRLDARHGEAGCEAEVFTALEAIRAICAKIEQPMPQVALAWLLHQPGVTSVIAGARTPEHVKQTAQAVNLQLSSEIIGELNEATVEVKEKLGQNPDMWQSVSRFR
jgi:aryl-alcohol dehydrogenase-like predicted oxidoreductase